MGLIGWHLRKHRRSRPSGKQPQPVGPWAGLVAGLALIALAALVVVVTVPRPIDAGSVPQGRIPALGHRARVPAVPPRSRHAADLAPVAALPNPETGPPRRLVVPALRINARVDPVQRIKNGSLAVPSNPRVLGWWARSAVPGSPVGTAVIDGHVDSAVAGLGALFYLHTLKPGARLIVIGPQGRLAYTVVGVREYPKSNFPKDLLFTQHVVGRLVIITCGGPFNEATRSYLDNVVAFAVPAARGAKSTRGSGIHQLTKQTKRMRRWSKAPEWRARIELTRSLRSSGRRPEPPVGHEAGQARA